MTAVPDPVPVSRRGRLPAGVLVWEPSERWVRGRKGEFTVVDSRRPVLFWEPGLPVPQYAFPEADVRTDLLRPAAAPSPRPHAGASAEFDLVIGDEVTANAAWALAGADLAGYLAFAWFGRVGHGLDHWYEEDEEIFVHPRDPHKRVDVIRSSRHVQVKIAGFVVADTRSPVLVFETGLPIRYYFPREDVRLELFTAIDRTTRCPYKGLASAYWSWTGGGDVPAGIAWSYPDPIPAAAGLRGLISFYNEFVDLVVDGELLERPITPFSRRLRH